MAREEKEEAQGEEMVGVHCVKVILVCSNVSAWFIIKGTLDPYN